jgi:DNA-binding MarR family transcriptional regulator
VTYVEESQEKLKSLMHRMHQGMLSQMEKMQKGENNVLRVLAMSDNESLTPKKIAMQTGLSSARVAAILTSLEKKDQIFRTNDPKDRRSVIVTLKKEGRVRSLREQDEIKKRMHFVFRKMGKADTEEFISLIEKFVDYQLLYEESCKDNEDKMKREGNKDNADI